MILEINDYVDWIRIAVGLLGTFSILILVQKAWLYRADWNEKSRDLLYSLGMWSLTGVVAVIQGIVLNRELTPATVLIVAATLVTLKALLTRGPWGRQEDDD